MATFRSIESLAEFVDSLPSPRLVGIVGSPGAGKSTIAAELVARLNSFAAAPPSAIVLPMDGYHYPQARLVELGRRERMGAPDTFDVGAFVGTLRELRGARSAPPATLPPALAPHHAVAPPRAVTPPRALSNSGRTILAPGFDRVIEEPVPDAIAILPELLTTVVVEGNYLLLDSGGWEGVAPLLDATLFVRVDRGIRQQRLIERHVRFGKSEPDARAWALGPDENNALTIEATAARADHTIDLG